MPEQSRHQWEYLPWTKANDGWIEARGTLTSLQDLTREVEQFRKENAELRAEVEKLRSGQHRINLAGTSPETARTVTVPCGYAAEVKQRRAQLTSARIVLNKAADQIAALRADVERLSHGRLGQSQHGELNARHKLTAEQVREIRSMLESGMKQRSIAERFCVHPTTVSAINVGKNWGALQTLGSPKDG